MSFIPAQELVRAKIDIARTDGQVVVTKGTPGIVENRDELVPSIYWVKFEGGNEAIAVRENELEIIQGGDMEQNVQARAWVADAMKRFGIAESPTAGQFGRDCPACRGPLVAGERLVCRGCAEPDTLDDEILDDLVEG